MVYEEFQQNICKIILTGSGFLNQRKTVITRLANANQTLLRNNDSWNVFTNTEVFYKRFIKEYSKRTYRCPTKREWKTQLKATESLARLFVY